MVAGRPEPGAVACLLSAVRAGRRSPRGRRGWRRTSSLPSRPLSRDVAGGRPPDHRPDRCKQARPLLRRSDAVAPPVRGGHLDLPSRVVRQAPPPDLVLVELLHGGDGAVHRRRRHHPGERPQEEKVDGAQRFERTLQRQGARRQEAGQRAALRLLGYRHRSLRLGSLPPRISQRVYLPICPSSRT